MYFKYFYFLYFMVVLMSYVESRPLSCSIIDEKFGSMLCCKVYAGSNSCRTLIPKNSFHFVKTWPLEIVKEANLLLERFQDKQSDKKELSSVFVSADAFRREQVEEERKFLKTILPEEKKDCCCEKSREIIIPHDGYSYGKDRKYKIYQDLPDRAQVFMKVSCVNSTCIQNHKNYSCAEESTYVPLYVVDEEYSDYLREVPIEVTKDCKCKEKCIEQMNHVPQNLGKELVKRFAESQQIKGELADIRSKLKDEVYKTYNVSNTFKLFENVVKNFNYEYNKAADNVKVNYPNNEKYEENFFDAASLILIATKLLDFNISNSDYDSMKQVGSREEIAPGQNISEGGGKFNKEFHFQESSPKIIEASTTRVFYESSKINESQNFVGNLIENFSTPNSRKISEDYPNERNQLLKFETKDSEPAYKTESDKNPLNQTNDVNDVEGIYENNTLNTFYNSKNYSFKGLNSYESDLIIHESNLKTLLLTTETVNNNTDNEEEFKRSSNVQTFQNDYSLETMTLKSQLPKSEAEIVTRSEDNLVSWPEKDEYHTDSQKKILTSEEILEPDSNSEISSVTKTEAKIKSLGKYTYNIDDYRILRETTEAITTFTSKTNISSSPLWQENSSSGKLEPYTLVSTEYKINTDSSEATHTSSSMRNFEFFTDDFKIDYNMETTEQSLEEKFPNTVLFENYTEVTTIPPDESTQKYTETLTTVKSQIVSIDTRNVSAFINDIHHNLTTNLKVEPLEEERTDSVSQTFQTTGVYSANSYEALTDQFKNESSRSLSNGNSEIFMESTIENFQGFETKVPDYEDRILYGSKVDSTRSFDNNNSNTISTIQSGLFTALTPMNDQNESGVTVSSFDFDRDNYELDNRERYQVEGSSEINNQSYSESSFNINVFDKENNQSKANVDTSVPVNFSISDKTKAIFEDTSFLVNSSEPEDEFMSEDSLSFSVDLLDDNEMVSKYSASMSLDSNTNNEIDSVATKAYNKDKFYFESIEGDEPITFPGITLNKSLSSSKNEFNSFQNYGKISESSILGKAIITSTESMKKEPDFSNPYEETYSTYSPITMKSDLTHVSYTDENREKIHPILDMNINYTRNLIKNTEIKNAYKNITFPNKPQFCEKFFGNCSLYCHCCMDMNPSINGTSIHVRETERGSRVKKGAGLIYDLPNSMSYFSETYRFLNSVLNKQSKNELETLLGKAEDLLILENELLRNKLSLLKTMMMENIPENLGEEFLEGKLYKNPLIKNIFSIVTEQIYKESKLSNIEETERNNNTEFLVNLLRNRNISPLGVYLTEILFKNGFINCKDYDITDFASIISISEILSRNVQYEVNKMLKSIADLLKSPSLDRLIRHLFAFRSKERMQLSYAEEDQIKIVKEDIEKSLLTHKNYFDKCKVEIMHKEITSAAENNTNRNLLTRSDSTKSTPSQSTYQNKTFAELSGSLKDLDENLSKEITFLPGKAPEFDNRYDTEVNINQTGKYPQKASNQILQVHNYSSTYISESTTEAEKPPFESSTLEYDNLSNDYPIYEERNLTDVDEYFATQIVNTETSIDNYEREFETIDEITLDMKNKNISEVTTDITNTISSLIYSDSEITDRLELDQLTLRYREKSEQMHNDSSLWLPTTEVNMERENTISDIRDFYSPSESNEVDNTSTTEEQSTLQSETRASIYITPNETTNTKEETKHENGKSTPSTTTFKSTHTTTKAADRNASTSSIEIERIQIDDPPPQYRPIDIDISKVLKLIKGI